MNWINLLLFLLIGTSFIESFIIPQIFLIRRLRKKIPGLRSSLHGKAEINNKFHIKVDVKPGSLDQTNIMRSLSTLNKVLSIPKDGNLRINKIFCNNNSTISSGICKLIKEFGLYIQIDKTNKTVYIDEFVPKEFETALRNLINIKLRLSLKNESNNTINEIKISNDRNISNEKKKNNEESIENVKTTLPPPNEVGTESSNMKVTQPPPNEKDSQPSIKEERQPPNEQVTNPPKHNLRRQSTNFAYDPESKPNTNAKSDANSLASRKSNVNSLLSNNDSNMKTNNIINEHIRNVTRISKNEIANTSIKLVHVSDASSAFFQQYYSGH